ncbi:MAG TPA: NDP-sugar synthase [Deferrisomatales bacterium]|nr:NDP-sugar synthase [Deferrisomatales bacterium]
MKAFVLAAGLGTRLRPLSLERPKPAWPLFDVPLAAHVLHALVAAGADDVVVNLHHLPGVMRGVLAPWVPAGVRVRWSLEEQILGTGGALGPWRRHLASEPFFLANADTYQELDLADLAGYHHRHGPLATLLLRPLAPGVDGPIEVDDTGRIVRFLARRAPGTRPGRTCEFCGVHLLEPEVLESLPEGPCCINADVHAALVARGAPLCGYLAPEDGFWSDLGTPQRYLGAHAELLALNRVPTLAPGRVVSGAEHDLGEGTVLGPSYLGPGARVEAGAVVGQSAVLGRGAVAEERSRVARSVLWEGARAAVGETVSGQVRSASGMNVGPD